MVAVGARDDQPTDGGGRLRNQLQENTIAVQFVPHIRTRYAVSSTAVSSTLVLRYYESACHVRYSDSTILLAIRGQARY
eukprot:62864-Rhodomonas_salina.2